MDIRKQREQSFHDARFGPSGERPADRFYSIADGSNRSYLEYLINRAPTSRVLEYGCGHGSAACILAARGATVSGIDISPVAIEGARAEAAERGLTIDFRVMDAEHLEFEDASFDVVCGSGILHHLDIERAYAQVARILRPQGVAVFLEPLGLNPLINAYRDRTPDQRTIDEHPLVRADFDLARRHFESTNVSYHHLTTLALIPFANSPFVKPLAGALDRVDSLLFRVFPPLSQFAWLCVMRLEAPKVATAHTSRPERATVVTSP